MTLSIIGLIVTFTMMTFSIIDLIVTLIIRDIRHIDTQRNDTRHKH
jgi:hypothetical protein